MTNNVCGAMIVMHRELGDDKPTMTQLTVTLNDSLQYTDLKRQSNITTLIGKHKNNYDRRI